MIVIDSDIFIISLFYTDDLRSQPNERFLSLDFEGKSTTIFNVLEVCGIASFRKSLDDRQRLFSDFHTTYNLQILYPSYTPPPEDILRHLVSRTAANIAQKMTFGDAIVVATAESARAEMLVTWNTRHFEGRTSLLVLTPETFLNRHTSQPPSGQTE